MTSFKFNNYNLTKFTIYNIPILKTTQIFFILSLYKNCISRIPIGDLDSPYKFVKT